MKHKTTMQFEFHTFLQTVNSVQKYLKLLLLLCQKLSFGVNCKMCSTVNSSLSIDSSQLPTL